jgi:hypothetical protein
MENPRVLWVQYQNIKGSGLEQFKKPGTQVIVYPKYFLCPEPARASASLSSALATSDWLEAQCEAPPAGRPVGGMPRRSATLSALGDKTAAVGSAIVATTGGL